MVEITAVHSASLRKQGIKPGDHLLKINSHLIRDSFDLEFYILEEPLQLVIRKSSGEKLNIRADNLDDGGLEVEDFKVQHCPNQCIFCFVDQMPPGLRPELYFKDDDYRLSFLYGNFITGTCLTQRDIQRIKKFHFSPLHISVHTVRPELRIKMLKNPQAGRIHELLKHLIQAGIQIHTQVVLCPGLNDGEVLDETIQALRDLYPQVYSLGIVPIGLTDYRLNLPAMEAFDAERALSILRQINPYQQRNDEHDGNPFVYLADEFYLMAGQPIPEAEHYGNFDQYENGIGMTAYCLYWFGNVVKKIGQIKLTRKLHLGFISGTLIAPLMEKKIIQSLNRIPGLEACLYSIPNRLFGHHVTVTGLLSGQCILQALKRRPEVDILFVPQNCLNNEGYFLDNLTLSNLSKQLGITLQPLDDHLKNLEKTVIKFAKL